MPVHRPTLVRSQSLRPCGAPPFTQGRLLVGATLLVDCLQKNGCRGRRPRRPGQPYVTIQHAVRRRGGFHIRPCSPAYPPNCPEGSRPLPTNRHKYHPTTQNRNHAQSPGASRTPPPTNRRMWAVGANIVRPLNLALQQNTTGGYGIRPYGNLISAPKGSILFLGGVLRGDSP